MPCMAYLRLSSPCGDKLQSVNLDTLFATEALSSPCGDKLQFLHQIIKGVLKNVKCFRPLTGIICETAYHEVGHLFPPPYGDHTKYITTHRKKEEPEGWKMFTLL